MLGHVSINIRRLKSYQASSSHNGMKVKISYKMKAGKNHRYMETKHILLKNCFINKKIKGKKYLKINKIMKTTYQNASYTSKGYEEGSL